MREIKSNEIQEKKSKLVLLGIQPKLQPSQISFLKDLLPP